MKITNMIELIQRIGGGNLDIHQERCVLVRNRNADCLRCAEVCVSGCISYESNHLSIDPSVCIGCGTCATACPTAALAPKKPTDKELLDLCEKAALAADGTVVVMCDKMAEKTQHMVDFSKAVVVPCIGRMEESLLMTLAAEGMSQVVLIDTLCQECAYNNGRVMADIVEETMHTLMDAWHVSMDLHVASKLPGILRRSDDIYDASRRNFFADVKDTASETAKEVATVGAEEALGIEQKAENIIQKLRVGEDGVLPHFVPDRRRQLLGVLEYLGEPEDVMFNTRLWGHVMIDTDKCKSCYMCAVFCPTGAMVKLNDEDGNAQGVGHIPSKCVKCRTCENICLGSAITISEEVFAVDMLAGMVESFEMETESKKNPFFQMGNGRK